MKSIESFTMQSAIFRKSAQRHELQFRLPKKIFERVVVQTLPMLQR